MTDLSSSAMLIDLRISVWTGRKKDKTTEAEVVKAHKALSPRAASVHKHLLVDAEPLLAITRFSSDCRSWLYANTLPWTDNGSRLLPTKNFFSFKQEMTVREGHFWALVKEFEREYPVLITSMALQLGDLFNRNEYPDPATIATKFGFYPEFSPVPEAGDFRVDIAADAKEELRARYQQASQQRLEQAMEDAWTRLHDTVKHMYDKLQPVAEGESAKRIHETMLSNASELCGVLTALNIANDPKLEQARKQLERVIDGLDTKSLREVPELRAATRTKLADVLDKFAM